MRVKKNINQPQLNSVSFLFENKKVSYVKRQEKGNYEKETFYSGNINLSTNIDIISEKLRKNFFYNQKYSFTDVSILTNNFTLIPTEHFDENLAEIFLNYTVPYYKNMGLRFDLIPQFDLVLVFYYLEEIESLFTEASDRIRISHTGFKFLSKIKSNDRRNGIFLNTYHEYFEIAVIENEKLLLYNIYPYAELGDIVYFLQFISKLKNIRLSQTILYYLGNLEEKKKDIEELSRYFSRVNPVIENDFERQNFTTLDLV